MHTRAHTHTCFKQVARKYKTAPRNLLKLATSYNLTTPLSYMNFASQPHKYENTYAPTQHLPTRTCTLTMEREFSEYFGSTQ